MLGESPRALERDRIALRAVCEPDQLDDRARMLEEVALDHALPRRPLGIEPKIVDAFGVEIGARERFEIGRSEEHTSELQSLMRISYAVFCLKKKKNIRHAIHDTTDHSRMIL